MKKQLLFIASALMLNAIVMKAQIIPLDTIVSSRLIGYDFYTVQISADETKYFFSDTITNTFSLYNLDFTPFMENIPVPEPFAMNSSARMQVVYITRTLFDCDSTNIEYAYYAPTNSNKPFRIMRTDGTVLLYVDSANGPYCSGGCLGFTDVVVPIRKTSDGTKLFVQKYTPAQQIYIYSLCGDLPVEIFDFKQEQSFIKVFPNPASEQLTFQINLPDNKNEYELVILDNNAKEIQREKINYWDNRYTVDVSRLNSGTYYYTLRTKYKPYQSGKFILNK
ncbi:MAG: hypothetical protein KatS3mg031_3104 [Chitinophagales bacterium]|nr:MAG: hypothetical protein KatS3mg031_3104 [Chitinophagales bacterium]